MRDWNSEGIPMKLVIQIPCFNEEANLDRTIRDLPVRIDGIDSIEILVIDDGSTDRTISVAHDCGVHHVLPLNSHLGLARAFSEGIRYSIYQLQADIIVNTDADNQYQAGFIADLIRPILDNTADITVGCRPIHRIPHFSTSKKLLQKTGSAMVRFLTGFKVDDAASGFRAYSRRAARRIKIVSDFTYTIESLIQASRSGLRLKSIPVEVNPPVRPSRLFRGAFGYIARQIMTMFRIWALYSPVKLFVRTGLLNLVLGGGLLIRFVYYYISSWPEPSGKVQSLIISSVFLMFGFFLVLIGVIADLLAINRRLTEDVIDRLDEIDIKG